MLIFSVSSAERKGEDEREMSMRFRMKDSSDTTHYTHSRFNICLSANSLTRDVL